MCLYENHMINCKIYINIINNWPSLPLLLNLWIKHLTLAMRCNAYSPHRYYQYWPLGNAADHVMVNDFVGSHLVFRIRDESSCSVSHFCSSTCINRKSHRSFPSACRVTDACHLSCCMICTKFLLIVGSRYNTPPTSITKTSWWVR